MNLPISHDHFIQTYSTQDTQLAALENHTAELTGHLEGIEVTLDNPPSQELPHHIATIRTNFEGLQQAVNNPAAFATARQTVITGLHQAHAAATRAREHIGAPVANLMQEPAPPVVVVTAEAVLDDPVAVEAHPVQEGFFGLGDIAIAMPDGEQSSDGSLNVHTPNTTPSLPSDAEEEMEVLLQ